MLNRTKNHVYNLGNLGRKLTGVNNMGLKSLSDTAKDGCYLSRNSLRNHKFKLIWKTQEIIFFPIMEIN